MIWFANYITLEYFTVCNLDCFLNCVIWFVFVFVSLFDSACGFVIIDQFLLTLLYLIDINQATWNKLAYLILDLWYGVGGVDIDSGPIKRDA